MVTQEKAIQRTVNQLEDTAERLKEVTNKVVHIASLVEDYFNMNYSEGMSDLILKGYPQKKIEANILSDYLARLDEQQAAVMRGIEDLKKEIKKGQEQNITESPTYVE